MKKNSLTLNKGLSLSQAQSISNLCFQRAVEIDARLNGVNNYSKSIDITVDKRQIITNGIELPANIVELLNEKSALHACQAFLMENIKAKDLMLRTAKAESADISSVKVPERPSIINSAERKLPMVDENFGWEQLSTAELNEYLEAEAYAAHIGQFIHKDGLLTHLRNELPHVPPIDWMSIKDGERIPVYNFTHHTSSQLLKVHEELAAIHRKHEQRVNYFKAKVKNFTTEENARIAKLNADIQIETEKLNKESQTKWQTEYLAANEIINTIRADFEKQRQAKIKEIAAMRINVDPRFQKMIDMFLQQISDVQE